MQSSNQPGKISVPFANSGAKQPIPVASQVGIEDGRASYTDGFPPLTRTPLSAGGKPPFGTDMNGILNAATVIQQWQSAGGGFKYDSTFATAIGGYPAGAMLVRSDNSGIWVNTVDNNSTDPEAGGAGWQPDTSGSSTVAMTSANVTLTALQAARPIIIITGVLTANLNLVFPTYQKQWLVVNNGTGSFTVTCKTAAGGGVSVLTGASQPIYGNGTDIASATASQVQRKQSFRGLSKNLKASATGLSSSIVVSADNIVVANLAGDARTIGPVSLTLNTAAVASATVDGMATAAVAVSTWYARYVWYNSATGVTRVTGDSSFTAPTAPAAGFDEWAYCGSFKTDGTANKFPLSFLQDDFDYQFKVAAGSNVPAMIQMTSGSAGNPNDPPTWQNIGVGPFVSPVAKMLKCNLSVYNSGVAIVAPNNAYGGLNQAANTGSPFVGAVGEATRFGVAQTFSLKLEGPNIYYAASGTAPRLFVIGYGE